MYYLGMEMYYLDFLSQSYQCLQGCPKHIKQYIYKTYKTTIIGCCLKKYLKN